MGDNLLAQSRYMFIQKLALNKESFIPCPPVSSGGRKASVGDRGAWDKTLLIQCQFLNKHVPALGQ
jgi:hypothetical protein